MAKISINIKDGTVKKPATIVGIDLGTTNSLIAYAKGEEVIVLKNEDGSSTLVPSIVHFGNDNNILVGTAAMDQLTNAPERTIYSVKRLMGKSYKDIESFQNYLGYKIIDDDAESMVKIKVDEKYHSPLSLSAEILKVLKARAERTIGTEINQAVITVPAYFNDVQRQATRDAGKLAGLDVLRIVNEPTAASLAYGIGLNKEEEKKIAVYDLGGGTFDISLLEIQNGIFEVLSTNGDTFLGGDDFDRAIIDHWKVQLEIDDATFQSNKIIGQKVRLRAEEAKKHLSNNDTFETDFEGKKLSLTKETFETLITPLVQKTIACCKQALKDADLDISIVDHVVMVGGSTRVPLVKQEVSKFFGKEVFDNINPDEVVAKGAAIQADILAGNRKDMLLLDITPLSLGIETVGGLMDTIIARNSKVPSNVARQYTTSIDGQKNLKVAVYQGERDLVEHNRKLGEFILSGIPPMAAGIPKIEVQFLLNADGILTVKAKELRSNVATEIKIKSAYSISEEEMALMLLDSIKNAEVDVKIKGILEAKNEANNVILATDRFIKQNSSFLIEEEIAMINKYNQGLRESLKSEDKDEINKAMEALNEFTSPIAHRAMDYNIQQSLKGKQI